MSRVCILFGLVAIFCSTLLFLLSQHAVAQNMDQKRLQQLDQEANKKLEKLTPILRERLEKQVETEEQTNNPRNFFSHIRNLCVLLSDYGYNKQTVKAEATYKKIINLMNADSNPGGRSKANLMLYLGQACSDWGKPEYSEAAYRKGLAMVQIYEGDKKDKELQALFLSSLGEACLEERKFDEAQHYFQQVYEYRHSFVGEPVFVVEARLAEIYRYKKNYTESERLFKEALANFPQDNYTQKHYAQLLLDMGRTTQAQDINKQIVAETQRNSAQLTTWKMLLAKMAETPPPTKLQQDAINKQFAEKAAALNPRPAPEWYRANKDYFQLRIRQAWFPPAVSISTQSMIIFNISKNGALGLLQMVKSSGNSKFDDSCLGAIRNAKFPSFPRIAPDNMCFQITFMSDGYASRRLDLVWINLPNQR